MKIIKRIAAKAILWLLKDEIQNQPQPMAGQQQPQGQSFIQPPINPFEAEMAITRGAVSPYGVENHKLRIVKADLDSPITTSHRESRRDVDTLYEGIVEGRALTASGGVAKPDELSGRCSECKGFDTSLWTCADCAQLFCQLHIRVLEKPDELQVLCLKHIKEAKRYRDIYKYPQPFKEHAITELPNLQRKLNQLIEAQNNEQQQRQTPRSVSGGTGSTRNNPAGGTASRSPLSGTFRSGVQRQSGTGFASPDEDQKTPGS